MTNRRRISLTDRRNNAGHMAVYWSVEADVLDRAGRGEAAYLARTKADRWLRFQRKIGAKLYY